MLKRRVNWLNIIDSKWTKSHQHDTVTVSSRILFPSIEHRSKFEDSEIKIDIARILENLFSILPGNHQYRSGIEILENLTDTPSIYGH